MQNRDIYLMILGMTLVTYLPRVLPAFLMGRIRLSARVEHFLQLIPLYRHDGAGVSRCV